MKKKYLLALLAIPFLVACSNKTTTNDETNNNNNNNQQQVDDNSQNNNGNNNNDNEKVLSSLELEGYKAKFDNGEDFSVGELKVYAVYSNGDKTLVTDYTVDSSKYDKSQDGDYEIVISYSNIKKSYTVAVGKQLELPFV